MELKKRQVCGRLLFLVLFPLLARQRVRDFLRVSQEAVRLEKLEQKLQAEAEVTLQRYQVCGREWKGRGGVGVAGGRDEV